jgi:potassium-transporting ATPase potassium-binding subunit
MDGSMIESILVIVLALALGWPLGRYLAAIMRGAAIPSDRYFAWLEKPIYRLLGVDPALSMPTRHYVIAFLLSNAVLAAAVWLILLTQAWLPLNPNAAPNMRWDLALHTTLSFLTNTNQQHYSGQVQLSYFSQMSAIVGLQVVTPMMALALVSASLRALFGGQKDGSNARPGSAFGIGNYWADVIRPAVRLFLPLCVVMAMLLTSQGVPATLSGGPDAATLDQSAQQTQKVPLGPVAPMVATKQLGTNGGGWYGPNSAVSLENPTPLTNFLQTLAILLLPVAVVFMVDGLTGRKRFTALILGCMLTMSLLSSGAAIYAEAFAGGADAALMEGKEQRFGAANSALWASLTTQTSNGSVNMMHDSAAPLTGLVSLSNMMINGIFGGVGCGLMQFLVYLMLAVFLAGLMTGRTPELFGRKIEAAEIKWLALLVLLQPLLILGFSAITLSVPGLAGNSNPGFHGLSQVLYEYTSAFANNGSGFEGLGDASYWWNLSTSVVLVLGRYPALILPLIVAAMLGAKRVAPESHGSLRIETPTFALTLIAVIVILTLLQFMPVLVLGPIAEHLSLAAVR